MDPAPPTVDPAPARPSWFTAPSNLVFPQMTSLVSLCLGDTGELDKLTDRTEEYSRGSYFMSP